MSTDELIPIGRITGAHGIKGEVKLAPYGPLEDIEWTTLNISREGKPPEVRKVLSSREHKGVYLVVLEGVPDRNAAEALAGYEASVPESCMPEAAEDEFYYSDLVGMEVLTEEGTLLGRVENVFSTGSNDVLEVSGPSGEVLIPAIENVVLRVDRDGKKITVRLMEGLLPE